MTGGVVRRDDQLARAWRELYRARLALEKAGEFGLRDRLLPLLADTASRCKFFGIENPR